MSTVDITLTEDINLSDFLYSLMEDDEGVRELNFDECFYKDDGLPQQRR
jgi:hypothetical protein